MSPAAPTKPNVLFIVVDDLNDWLGCLGGHPQVKTPNIDRLAQRGVLFTNAHCAAPLCNPSRAALFSGRPPFATGVFANNEANIRRLWPDAVLLPQCFAQAGYRTFGAGKLLHSSSKGLFDDEFFPENRWSPFSNKQVEYSPEELSSKGTPNPRHVTQLNGQPIVLPLNRLPSERAPTAPSGESFDWGPLPIDDEAMGDGQMTTWAVERLRQRQDRPFFMGLGFYRPHIPLFAPQAYFDLYKDVSIVLPTVPTNDLEDLSPGARRLALAADTAGTHDLVVRHQQWAAAVKAYLACVSFVDAQVGKLLAAVDAGPNAKDTIILFMSDHGWHLGEKQHWGKWTGWQRATHVPMIISTPSTAPGRCNAPVSLLDIYPTLVDLCGLTAPPELGGQSLLPLLRDPHQTSDRHVLTTFDKGNYGVTGARWRYLRYADGAEELYDLQTDPHEWRNRAADPSVAAEKARLAQSIPDDSVYRFPAAGGSGAVKKKTKKS